MIMQDHIFEKKKFADVTQRGMNSCAVCSKVSEVHPPNPDIPRDVGREREIKKQAAGLSTHVARLNYSGLFTLAESRALPGPIRNADQRDNGREAEEEIADLVNYAVWEIQRLDRADVAENRLEWEHVIIKACELWDVLQEAKA